MQKDDKSGILNVLIPSRREPQRLNRLIDSLNLIEVKFCVRIIRNFEKEPFKDYSPFSELAKNPNFTGVVDYNSTNALGELYKELYRSVPEGEYFIFLEDDDYLISGIQACDLSVDLSLCGYRSEPNAHDALNWEKTRRAFLGNLNLDVFKESEEKYNSFQISCMIAKKKEALDDFIWSSDLSNDFKLFMRLMSSAYAKGGKGVNFKHGLLFQQTVQDNISFPEFNKDTRWATD